MKKTAKIPIAIIAIAACNNPDQVKKSGSDESALEMPAVRVAQIKFEQPSFDFGVITPGEQVAHTFVFINTGDLPLKITGAQASCGCTVPEFPREQINPGQKGIVNVIFNSANKSGLQDAVITIISDGEPGTSILHLTGDIKAPEELKLQ